jgi:hypothetical protein
MSALPLLLALAVSADPAATPAEPAAQAQPAAATEAEADAPGFIVAPPDAPGVETPAPAKPYVLDGYLPPARPVAGATVWLGGSSAGLEASFEAAARWHGVVAGVTVGSAGKTDDGVRTLGLLAGYGYARGHYRGEALLGWGLASDRRDAGGVTERRSGHFRSVQVGLDRALAGGDAWRATLGAGLWWRETFGLRGVPASHDEVGGGLRLGLETGL